jgi:hypothetical protein
VESFYGERNGSKSRYSLMNEPICNQAQVYSPLVTNSIEFKSVHFCFWRTLGVDQQTQHY